MADIEKVIYALKCRGDDIRLPCEKFPCDCPYHVKKDENHSYEYCDLHRMLDDARELLEEQSRKQMLSFNDGYAEGYKAKNQEIVRCKDCAKRPCVFVIANERTDNWYCANGKRRAD